MSAEISHLRFSEISDIHIRYDSIESKEIDVVNMRRRRRDNNCGFLYNTTLSNENRELKRKLDELSNALYKVKNELESVKEKTGFIERRSNKTPLTILLSIANDPRLNPNVYSILDDKLSLVTQCQMLLHKNKCIVDEGLRGVGSLHQKDIEIIKSVINNYNEITKSMCYESKREEFIFSIIWYSIECCGRIQDIVTTEYWLCVHYLTIYLSDQVHNFEEYLSRYIPLKLPKSIIDDICNKYKYIFCSKPFDDQLRTLKDIIKYCSNNIVMNGFEKRFQKYDSEVTEDTKDTEPQNDDDDIFDPLNDVDIKALQQQHDIEWIDDTTNDDDIKAPFVPDPNAKNFVPQIKSAHLSTINEDNEVPSTTSSPCTPQYYEEEEVLNDVIGEYIVEEQKYDAVDLKQTKSKSTHLPAIIEINEDPEIEIQSPSTTLSPCTPQYYEEEEESASKYKHRTSHYNHRGRSQVFISKDMISRLNAECIESFNTNILNDEGLVFDYFKNSVLMQINDAQMNDKGGMVIINIDLHFNVDGETMYLIAMENDIGYRERVPWRIVGFMRDCDLYKKYRVNRKQLPKSSRKSFKNGLERPPNNACLYHIISRTNFKKLPKKFTKRQNARSFLPKTRITQSKLKFFCKESYRYNAPTVPVVVIKGKKQWIEWKKFIKIFDSNGNEEWIGFSLRYHKSNKQWKIECLEYDAGRIYYQHRLIGDIDHKYCYSFNEIAKYITTSLEIV